MLLAIFRNSDQELIRYFLASDGWLHFNKNIREYLDRWFAYFRFFPKLN